MIIVFIEVHILHNYLLFYVEIEAKERKKERERAEIKIINHLMAIRADNKYFSNDDIPESNIFRYIKPFQSKRNLLLNY